MHGSGLRFADPSPALTASWQPFGPQPPDELQLEYFVPLEKAGDALRAVQRTAAAWPLLYSELRAVAADDLWLSSTTAAGGGDTLAIAFGLPRDRGVDAALAAAAEMEATLAPFFPKPHWGKLHGVSTVSAGGALCSLPPQP